MPRLNSLLSVSLIVFVYSLITPAYAQRAGGQTLLTGAGEIVVDLDISFPEREEVATVFTITFSDPVTGGVEEHVYYDFLLAKDGKNVFRAGTYGGAPAGIIHSVIGIEKQYFTFAETGSYTARVVVYGLKMVFVNPVAADFPVAVTPEFQVIAPVLTVTTAGIVFLRFRMKKFSWSPFSVSLFSTGIQQMR